MKVKFFVIVSAVHWAFIVAPAHARETQQLQRREKESIWRQITEDPAKARSMLDSELLKDPSSPTLNFLNGLIYDARSTPGSEGRQLAIVGYITALRADPTYWPANYQLGLTALEEGRASAAQQFLAAAAIFALDEPQVFYALARAAYCAGDISNSQLAFSRATRLAPPKTKDELLTAALVAASSSDEAAAQKWLDDLTSLTGVAPDFYLADRVKNLTQARNGSESLQQSVKAESAAVVDVKSGAASTRKKMAIVDVILIRRAESLEKVSGLNLLDALTLQLAGTLVNSGRQKSVDRIANTTTSDIVNTDYGISLVVPAVTYSLNIANALGNKSIIQARPSILIYDGQPSKIFAGGTLTYATSGQLSSQSYTKEVDLTLSVTPKFNDDESVNLTIATSLETFLDANLVGTFREAVQTEKSSTDVIADLNFGQTILVSAGAFNNSEAGQSSTPILSRIPLLGNLFRQKYNSVSTSDLLVLLSLRRQGVAAEDALASDSQRVSKITAELWKKLNIEVQSNKLRLSPEAHSDYYFLSNPGRALDRLYLAKIGYPSE